VARPYKAARAPFSPSHACSGTLLFVKNSRYPASVFNYPEARALYNLFYASSGDILELERVKNPIKPGVIAYYTPVLFINTDILLAIISGFWVLESVIISTCF